MPFQRAITEGYAMATGSGFSLQDAEYCSARADSMKLQGGVWVLGK